MAYGFYDKTNALFRAILKMNEENPDRISLSALCEAATEFTPYKASSLGAFWSGELSVEQRRALLIGTLSNLGKK